MRSSIVSIVAAVETRSIRGRSGSACSRSSRCCDCATSRATCYVCRHDGGRRSARVSACTMTRGASGASARIAKTITPVTATQRPGRAAIRRSARPRGASRRSVVVLIRVPGIGRRLELRQRLQSLDASLRDGCSSRGTARTLLDVLRDARLDRLCVAQAQQMCRYLRA